MSVRICGHRLRMEKPIKPYTFFKNVALLFVLSVIIVTPVYAADMPQQSSSSATAIHRLPSNVSGVDKTVPRKTPPMQSQRSAGSPSAAMALAMALGVRTVSGPMEQSQAPQHKIKTSRVAME